MTYEELAPTVSSLGITELQVETYLAKQVVVNKEPEPTVTKTQVIALANIFFPNMNWAESNGINGAAGQTKLSVNQVKMLEGEFRALKAEFDKPEIIE